MSCTGGFARGCSGALLACLAVAGVLAAGCRTRLYELESVPDLAMPDLTQPPKRGLVDLSPTNKLDLMVMMDNSRSMDPMQQELRSRFPQLLKPLFDLAQSGLYVDLHLGVVTSDYGAGATGSGGCDPSPGGQQGKLQAIGEAANFSCRPPVGSNFVAFSFVPNGQNNLPKGQSLSDTFSCMASVGSAGCGYEHQLESVYQALTGNLAPNRGFLRNDAVLGVLFVTNEDDASAPTTTDVFDDALTAQYGYPDSYTRQTRFAIQCGMPADFPPYQSSMGPLADCASAPDWPTGAGPGKQFDIRRYTDLFSLPRAQGGLKDDTANVLLFAIDGPESPFEVILSNPQQFGTGYMPCGKLDEKVPCVPVLKHSCVNASLPGFFGDPSIRLNKVIRSVPNNGVSSICDSDYSGALAAISKVLVERVGQGCVTFALPQAKGAPVADCDVYDQSLTDPGVRTPIPACSSSAPPCWRLDARPSCSLLSPQGVGITVDRNGQNPPIGTVAKALCTEA